MLIEISFFDFAKHLAQSEKFVFNRSCFSEKGKYYIDFKNGEGAVGQGDPEHKPDVTITMNEEVFLKIFNREFFFAFPKPILPTIGSSIHVLLFADWFARKNLRWHGGIYNVYYYLHDSGSYNY